MGSFYFLHRDIYRRIEGLSVRLATFVQQPHNDLDKKFEEIDREIHSLNRKVIHMGAQQDALDVVVTTLVTQFQQVADEVAALQALPAAEVLDFTALNAAVQAVTDAVPDAVTPPVTDVPVV